MEVNEGLIGKHKWWLVMTIVGVVLSFWLLMVVGNVWEEQIKLKNTVGQLQMKIRVVDELNLEKGLLGERIVELENFLVRGEVGVTKLAQGLEEAADSSGVELNLTFEDFPEKIDINGKYQLGLEMKAEVIGGYQAVINWLRLVEKLPSLVQFKEVKIGLSKFGLGVKAEFSGILFLINE